MLEFMLLGLRHLCVGGLRHDALGDLITVCYLVFCKIKNGSLVKIWRRIYYADLLSLNVSTSCTSFCGILYVKVSSQRSGCYNAAGMIY